MSPSPIPLRRLPYSIVRETVRARVTERECVFLCTHVCRHHGFCACNDMSGAANVRVRVCVSWSQPCVCAWCAELTALLRCWNATKWSMPPRLSLLDRGDICHRDPCRVCHRGPTATRCPKKASCNGAFSLVVASCQQPIVDEAQNSRTQPARIPAGAHALRREMPFCCCAGFSTRPRVRLVLDIAALPP